MTILSLFATMIAIALIAISSVFRAFSTDKVRKTSKKIEKTFK